MIKSLRNINWLGALALSVILSGITEAEAQGTITFDFQPLWTGTSYFESGMNFKLIIPQGSSYDDMGIIPASWANNVPQNNTPYMFWFQQYNPSDYVSLSLADGSSFGLNSVQLADPNSPSASPVPISFVGYLSGGSTVTETFTTPGNSAAAFATYTFNSEFASGLTHVDILAPKWAMDNLSFTVPEPDARSLAVLGMCFGLCYRKWRAKARH